ncbi:MAG: type II secretion system protein [Actinomycetota bacterium]
MKTLYKYLKRDQRGFTLVELLIVVIILAVLSGIAVPSYMALRNRARESATENEMKNIATALELYNADQEEYPDDDTFLGDDLSDGDNVYMSNVPATDAWGNDYQYSLSDGSYTLTSYGVDGAADGDDDIIIVDGAFTETGAY